MHSSTRQLVSCCIFLIASVDIIASTTAEEVDREQIARLLNATQTATNTISLSEKEEYTNEELDKWEPPEWIVKNYPYYLSGYDDEHRPIWVSEWGKYDLRTIAEGGEEGRKLFRKYVEKAERNIASSIEAPDNPLMETNIILDFDGFGVDQFLSLPTTKYTLDIGRDHRESVEHGRITKVIIVNANYVTEGFLRLGRTVFGRIFEVVEVYGTNKARWIPRLLRLFPRDQLPEWYGGTKNHKPVAIYG